MGKCSAEQRLAFLIPQVHRGFRAQVSRVVEVSAVRGMEVAPMPAAPLRLAACCFGQALAALLLSPLGPSAQLSAAPQYCNQLQAIHCPELGLACGW